MSDLAFHISANGDDLTGDGTIQKPFQSFIRARDALLAVMDINDTGRIVADGHSYPLDTTFVKSMRRPKMKIYVGLGTSNQDGSIGRPFHSVDEAINYAVDDDTIIVAPGYYGRLAINRIFRNLTIEAAIIHTVQFASIEVLPAAKGTVITFVGVIVGNPFVYERDINKHAFLEYEKRHSPSEKDKIKEFSDVRDIDLG